jgi:hypothetical protein
MALLRNELKRHRFKSSAIAANCSKAASSSSAISSASTSGSGKVHELAHLVTHRGFGEYDLSGHFMEYTAQCLTYAYLKPKDGGH